MLGATSARDGEAGQTWSFRGSKSRNKVSVGEPAEGSLKLIYYIVFEANTNNH